MHNIIFFSRKTVNISTIVIVVMSAFSVLGGILTKFADYYDYYITVALLLLTLFLSYSYKKDNLQGMQAGCCGTIVCIVVYQSSYVLSLLLGQGENYFITLGFWGSIYLAGEIMILILETIYTLNHYFTFLLDKPNLIRVALSEAMVYIISLFLLAQIFVTYKMTGEISDVIYVAAFNISCIAALFVVACSEVIISIDAGVTK